ncbi:MAG: flagellar basal body P-ring formation chaperone FlgA [Rhodobacteraceae bacterium]|nr:flagellar basal body P-ring formation chaperone FlgA [Paracoccaceae bacterium]
MAGLALALALPGHPARAGDEGLFRALRTIPAGTVVTAADVAAPPDGAGPAAPSPVGLAARVTLFAGRPIRPADVTTPAAVLRNQAVVLRYLRGALSIEDAGRALDDGAPGEVVRAMNTTSKIVVTGIVAPDGALLVGTAPAGAVP